jgi:hypothetical protein
MTVSFCNRRKRWRADICHNGARMHIGYYVKKDDADNALGAVLTDISTGNIPEKLRTKRVRVRNDSHKCGEIRRLSEEEFESTKISFPVANGKVFTIESYTRVIVADTYARPAGDEIPAYKKVMFMSLPRVRWLERQSV